MSENNQNARPVAFIRPAAEEDGWMSGDFTLENIGCVLQIDPSDGTVMVYKKNRDGTPGKKPVARGKVSGNRSTTKGAPQIVGTIRTDKGSRFRLAGWEHGDEGDEFYSLEYETLQLRKGKFFRPSK